jgi:hypothetical protein
VQTFLGENPLTTGTGVATLAEGGDGTKTVADSEVRRDRIDLGSTTALGQITFTQHGQDVRITGSGIALLVLGETVPTMQGAANFLF